MLSVVRTMIFFASTYQIINILADKERNHELDIKELDGPLQTFPPPLFWSHMVF